MRQSIINDAQTCLHRLDFSLLPDRPRNTSVSAAIGTGYHAGLAAAYRRRHGGEMWVTILPDTDFFVVEAIGALALEVETVDAFDWTLQAETARKQERIIDFVEASDLVEALVRRYFEHQWYWGNEYRVAAVEHHFELPWGPTWVRTGTFDLVVADENDRYTVVDHKTAKTKWRRGKADAYSSVQQGWYQQAWVELSGSDNVTGAYDVQTLDGDFVRWPAHRTERQRKLALKQGVAVAKIIEKGGPYPPTPDSFLCHPVYCDWWSQCEFGEGLHETIGGVLG